MRVLRSDPRDQTRETEAPSFRVFFWSQDRPGPEHGWTADEWELLDGDVEDALSWVHAHHHGRRASLWAVIRAGDEVHHVRLAGTDPTAPDDTWPQWADSAWPAGPG